MNAIVKNNGVTFGLLLGVILILTTTISYVIDYTLFMNMWIGISMIILYIIVGVVVVSKTKKQLGNQITFKEAFTSYFLAGIIAATMSVVFNIILFNYIDPQAKDSLNDMTRKYSIEMMEKFGAPASEVEKVRAELEATDNYSPAGLGKGLIFSFILNAVFAAILGLIFKNKVDYRE